METSPDGYEHKVPVPGLVDMAQPGFAEVDVKSKLREAFWYRRTFRVEGSIPAVAVLKVHKAMFGTLRKIVPRPIPSGWDYEKRKFIPGIFDSVELILTGSPHIAHVQAVHDIEKKTVTVHAWLQSSDPVAASKRSRPRGGRPSAEADVHTRQDPSGTPPATAQPPASNPCNTSAA